MNEEGLENYYKHAESWSEDRERFADRSRRLAWIAAGVAALIALVEAFALWALVPLKREVPYTLLVDRQTGYIEALDPLEERRVSGDAALTRSFLVQYVIAREGFDISTLQLSYRKVSLWSVEDAKARYLREMNEANPLSPLASMSRSGTIDIEVRSVSSLSANTALVRFSTLRNDRSAQFQAKQHWAAVVKYRYTDAKMSTADRLINPLGFQVTRYRKDAETLPEEVPSDNNNQVETTRYVR